ncbi:U3 snoRNP protein [Collariella sp. IMI 366227]|nr:U3 snoRNP protein [Collariella sp. IMI 366227]
MAGVSDKARFYLERAAPELREFEEKEIFSSDEIRSLVSKRSDYEHLILSPGTKPTDFLSYITWERSLDRLRAKRCRRLNIRSSSSTSSHNSHARTFGIFERAVNKHPGSVLLWRAYLDFAAQAKATKRWKKIVTRAIRLHPTDAGLWALAGKKAARAGDMERARAHFLRGCRFCTGEAALWVEGNAMEAIKATEAVQEGDVMMFDEEDEESTEEGELMLPDPDAVAREEGKKRAKAVFDEEATRKMEQSPALSGAIPMAIFDISRKQPFFGPAAAEEFFAAFAAFGQVSSQARILQHVLAAMEEAFPNHPCTCSCEVRQPVVGVDVLSAEFPKALRESLARLKSAMERTDDKKALAGKVVAWVDDILEAEGLDAAITMVLEHTKRSLGEYTG